MSCPRIHTCWTSQFYQCHSWSLDKANGHFYGVGRTTFKTIFESHDKTTYTTKNWENEAGGLSWVLHHHRLQPVSSKAKQNKQMQLALAGYTPSIMLQSTLWLSIAYTSCMTGIFFSISEKNASKQCLLKPNWKSQFLTQCSPTPWLCELIWVVTLGFSVQANPNRRVFRSKAWRV